MTYLIKETYQSIYEINKSKFIAFLFPIETIDDFHTTLKDLKKKHPNANHFCYALSLKNENIVKSSDDKEPAGSAGVVILNALNYKMITNCALVIVRYFGGIKLGVGGLARAYNQTASQVLEQAVLYEEIEMKEFSIQVSYNLEKSFERFLETLSGVIIKKDYFETIKYHFAIPANISIDSISSFFLGKNSPNFIKNISILKSHT